MLTREEIKTYMYMNILVARCYGNHFSAFSKTRLQPELRWIPTLLQIAGCILAFSTRGKWALGPLLPAPASASKRETPTSNLTESTAILVKHRLWWAVYGSFDTDAECKKFVIPVHLSGQQVPTQIPWNELPSLLSTMTSVVFLRHPYDLLANCCHWYWVECHGILMGTCRKCSSFCKGK